MSNIYKIAVLGAGPSGMSAAVRAAELGISHVLIEAAPHLANTIHRFTKGKLVMAEPQQLPTRSTLPFAAGTREAILASWQQEVDARKVNVQFGVAVTSISGQQGAFDITLASGANVAAENVVLAIGMQGNLRKLGVPGSETPWVQYQLDDPDEYSGETIVVVGAGDAGIENALALSKQNQVILLNREEEFNFCKPANLAALMDEVSAGKIETRISTTVVQVDEYHDEIFGSGQHALDVHQMVGADNLSRDDFFNLKLHLQTPHGVQHIKCHRVIARLGATPPRALLESFGIGFSGPLPSALPELSERYESSVPGIYVVGALAGNPLIKQSINQGFEVVEYIQGNPVELADEAMLREKLAGLEGISSVNEGIELIHRVMPLFTSLTKLQLREQLSASEVHVPKPGETIFNRNDYSDSFFSIIRGNVEVHAESEEGETTVFDLRAGNFFGEMGLLNGRRRTATVTAGENCVLMETPRRAMLKLLNSAPSVKRKLDEVSLKRAVQLCLDTPIPDASLEKLVETAIVKNFAVGEALFHQGDKADGLYLIRKGSVTSSRMVNGKEVILGYVAAGHYVGEMALLSNEPRYATVRAAAPTETILLEAVRLNAFLSESTSMRRKVYGNYLSRAKPDEQLAEIGESSELVNFLMGEGLGEATDVLLIDYSRCIRCDNCEKACAQVHEGSSRLNRRAGPTFGQIHIPTSCRHCEHPHCMKDCPPDAIHRAVNGEVYIGDNCIGCGNCQRNCPYDVIQMEADLKCEGMSLGHLLFGGKVKCASQDAPEKSATDAPKKAVKCDMCKSVLGGAACVRMCPTGAAMRVGPEQLLGLLK